MQACGWNVIDIEDGCFDVTGIVDALLAAKKADKPTFINVKTVIGVGSKAAGTADAHGAAFGAADVASMKRAYNFDPEQHFVIGDEVRQFFAGIPARGEAYVEEWNSLVARYEQAYPELGAKFRDRVAGKLPPRWKELVPAPGTFPTAPTASRAASGLVLNPIAKELENFMVGTADLSPSVHMIWPGKVDFQHVSQLHFNRNRDLTGIFNIFPSARSQDWLRNQRKLYWTIYTLWYPGACHVRHC